MRISKITLNNFKGFKGECVIDISHNIICFVGENNTGKTTLFKAIDFLKNGVVKDKSIEDYKHCGESDVNVSVEVEITGNLTSIIKNFSESKFLPYIINNCGTESIRLKRSSEKLTITQKSKPVSLDENKICTFNPETKQFENPAGFDKAINSIFESVFVWSDMDATDVTDFSSTKILGKLLKESSLGFEKSQEWHEFKEAHRKAFLESDNSLLKKSQELISSLEDSLSKFYGKANVRFNFSLPEPTSFIKAGDVHIDDGVDTSLSEKGSGMQRAFALSVIKVYADFLAKHPENSNLIKPLFFFIDEPEISLHPKAQSMLISAIQTIAQHQQVFITTHSPHLLKMFSNQDTSLMITKKENLTCSLHKVEKMDTFDFSPTLSEIGYFAFGILSNDFHNELYGYIEYIAKDKGLEYKGFDNFVNTNYGIARDQPRMNTKSGNTENVTLMSYIRHAIHHPENRKNPEFKECDLKKSILQMLDIIEKLKLV